MVEINILVGPPSAGKSSHAEAHKADGDTVVDFDKLATALGSGTSHDAPAAIKTVTFAARQAAIDTILDGVETDAWIIHSKPTPEQLETYTAAGAMVTIIDPGIDAVLEQAVADGRPAWTEQVIRDWYDDRDDAAAKSAPTPIMKGGQAVDPINISKTFSAKAELTETPGEFVALVSVFGNTDSHGDIVEAGAFTKTLAEWIIKGRPIPVVWSHQFNDPDSILGKYVEAQETADGLLLRGQYDMDHPKAARVHKLMLDELIVEFSFSGQVRDYELIESDDEDSWWPGLRIKDIDLWEAGPCFKGSNPETELISIKSDGRLTGSVRAVQKEGRVLAQKHVSALKDAHTQLGEIIAAVDSQQDADATKSTPVVPAPATKSALTPQVRALLDLSL